MVVWNARLRAKLLFGSEGLWFTQSLRKRLINFQVRGIRHVLRVPTTFIDRQFSHARLLAIADSRLRAEHVRSALGINLRRTYSCFPTFSMIGRFAHSDTFFAFPLPMRLPILGRHDTSWCSPAVLRVGLPRQHWLIEVAQPAWDRLHSDVGVWEAFDADSPLHLSFLLDSAVLRIPKLRRSSPFGLFVILMFPILSLIHI